MKINNENKLNRIISLLDTHILNELKKKEVNDDKLSVLTDIRGLYIVELNNVLRGENIRNMFDKKYWESYRKSNSWK